MSYYKIDVTMTNGFKYSYTCAARQMAGMRKSSEGYWTESVVATEISKEEHLKWNHYVKIEEPVKATKPKVKTSKDDKTETLEPVKTTRKPKGKSKLPKFASLEDFFENE